MSEQKPSVGRIVLYRAFGTPGGEYPAVDRAAVVTQVHGDGPGVAVGLAVLNPTGIFFNTSISYSEEALPGTWRWPPRV